MKYRNKSSRDIFLWELVSCRRREISIKWQLKTYRQGIFHLAPILLRHSEAFQIYHSFKNLTSQTAESMAAIMSIKPYWQLSPCLAPIRQRFAPSSPNTALFFQHGLHVFYCRCIVTVDLQVAAGVDGGGFMIKSFHFNTLHSISPSSRDIRLWHRLLLYNSLCIFQLNTAPYLDLECRAQHLPVHTKVHSHPGEIIQHINIVQRRSEVLWNGLPCNPTTAVKKMDYQHVWNLIYILSDVLCCVNARLRRTTLGCTDGVYCIGSWMPRFVLTTLSYQPKVLSSSTPAPYGVAAALNFGGSMRKKLFYALVCVIWISDSFATSSFSKFSVKTCTFLCQYLWSPYIICFVKQ